MDRLIVPAAAVPAELADWLEQAEGSAMVAALQLDAQGRLVLQALPEVDPLAIPRVLKSIVQYEEVLRRLA